MIIIKYDQTKNIINVFVSHFFPSYFSYLRVVVLPCENRLTDFASACQILSAWAVGEPFASEIDSQVAMNNSCFFIDLSVWC